MNVAAQQAVALHGRVLVADGQAGHRRRTSAMLGELGLEVSETPDGAGAVALALSGHFDLILMDLTTPLLDGIAATARLRAAGYKGPIVALTASLVAAEVRHYLARGFSDCIAKPLDGAALAAQLAGLLAPARAARVASRAGAQPVLLDLAVLCALFAARLPMQVLQMQQFAASGDWRELSKIAHFIKGAGASFGHVAEGEVAARLDDALLKGNHAVAMAELGALAERVGMPAYA